MSNEQRRESGEKLDSENIGHRALAKIGFAGKVNLPDARIVCREICWRGDVIHHLFPIPHSPFPIPHFVRAVSEVRG
jgi:hypothetical protein